MHTTDTETLLVPTGEAEFSGIIRGNETLGYICECLKEDTTREAIIERMKAEFDVLQDIIEGDVDRALKNLRETGALDE